MEVIRPGGTKGASDLSFSLDNIVNTLSAVPGVRAVVLGGSRGREEAYPDSDVDIGLYYDAASLDVGALDDGLTILDDEKRTGLLHLPGEWGPWVNGGGWLTVGGTSVDVLLRDLARAETVVRDCVAGRIIIDWQCGHPFGFVNAIYAAEVHDCMPLWQDETRPVERLRALLSSEGAYPPRMREAMAGKFLWEAGFSMDCGRKAALRGDLHYAIGSVFRTVGAWTQLLYAVNGRYQMNEKGSLATAASLPVAPQDLSARVEGIYLCLAQGRGEDAWQKLAILHAEIEGLVKERIRSRPDVR